MCISQKTNLCSHYVETTGLSLTTARASGPTGAEPFPRPPRIPSWGWGFGFEVVLVLIFVVVLHWQLVALPRLPVHTIRRLTSCSDGKDGEEEVSEH